MNTESVVIIILGVVVIGLNVCWAWISMRLIDRLMSRNYQDFALSEKIKTNKPKASLTPNEAVGDPESERQAQELNSLFNIA